MMFFRSLLIASFISATTAGFAEDSCDAPEFVPLDNSLSPTTRVRCCGGVYGDKNAKDKKWASCDTSSCPNNFNHMKNLNCHNYGSPQHPLDIRDPESKGGSNICPYYKKDKAICDVSFYIEENNGLNCRTNENGKNFQVHCLGKVKCGSAGVTVPKKGKSDGTDGIDGVDFGVCESGAIAGMDCFYNGASENFKVCDGGASDEELEEAEEAEKWADKECHQKFKACENGYRCQGVKCVVDDSIPEPVPAPGPDPGPAPGPAAGGPAPGPVDDVPNAGSSTSVRGDPHFKTHAGEMYDFHGGCDLVLLENPEFHEGLGMTVHIRTKIDTWWSYVEAAVVRIGDELIEINEAGLFLNGVAIDDLELNQFKMTKFAGLMARYKRTATNSEAHVYLGEGSLEEISLKTFKGFVKVELFGPGSAHYTGSSGLLGRFPDGKRVGRDGETVIEDVNAFGKEWQVKPEEAKLFHTYEDAWVVPAGQMCAMPTQTEAATKLRGRRLANGMDTAEAEKACSHLDSADDRKACVYDVVSTQDVSMASVW